MEKVISRANLEVTKYPVICRKRCSNNAKYHFVYEKQCPNETPSIFKDTLSSYLSSSLPKPRATKRALWSCRSKFPDEIESFYKQDAIDQNDTNVKKI